MDNSSIYADIAARTGGNIYIGVVGPVRTGKSTFIKRFMETLVLPNISDDYVRERARDELPQSGSGRTIMTAEPKFVPEDAVSIELDASVRASVRLIDSVGYMIPGANGQYENGEERLVTTPWYDHEIPMRVAAEEGTRKVIREHSTIGIVVTTDGSVTELAREDYAAAEARIVAELQDIGKPFLILLNTADPAGEAAQTLAAQLREQYDAACLPVNCLELTEQDILEILRSVLYEFPVTEACFRMPEWMDVLPPENETKQQLYALLREQVPSLHRLRDARRAAQVLADSELLEAADVENVSVDTGGVCYVLTFPRALYYSIISEQAGVSLRSDGELISFLAEMGRIQDDYRTSAAHWRTCAARATGSSCRRPVICSWQSRRLSAKAGATASGSRPAQKPFTCSRLRSRQRSRRRLAERTHRARSSASCCRALTGMSSSSGSPTFSGNRSIRSHARAWRRNSAACRPKPSASCRRHCSASSTRAAEH